MGAAGQVVAQVAEGVLDGAEQLAVGQIDKFIGHAFEDGVGIAAQGLEDVLTTLFTVL
jgi:hypothetical protein